MRWLPLGLVLLCANAAPAAEDAGFDKAAAILRSRCLRCHDARAKGGFDLTRREVAIKGGENGTAIVPGKPTDGLLLSYVDGDEPLMPKEGDKLTAEEVATLRRWIADGAKWPAEKVLRPEVAGLDWWSLKALERPVVPEITNRWIRTPIDAFIVARLRKASLEPSPEADRRTLIRRLAYDLHGLPPRAERVERFVLDERPDAYERLVDELLADPAYGERWARHWLDVAHYADTHGYDKDKVRPNAWPYRDYVIRSFNDDKSYDRFIREQLAGDHFFPGTRDGITGLGFLAAGPFDFVGQIEVRRGTIEKKRVRNLDRDDMVTVTMNTFCSLTVQCARCHDHEFDPVTQEDYYSLQAVFAAVDRGEREFATDPTTIPRRRVLLKERQRIDETLEQLAAETRRKTGPRLAVIDGRLKAWNAQPSIGAKPEFGYHSRIEKKPDTSKWVQIDLGRPREISDVVVVGCHDDFAGIGAGFGFPRRFRIEASDDPTFQTGIRSIFSRTDTDYENPGVEPRLFRVPAKVKAQYVRITATKLAERKNDFIFALGEVAIFGQEGRNIARDAKVTSLDSIQAAPRWQRKNLVDGYHFGRKKADDALLTFSRLQNERRALIEQATDRKARERQKALERRLADIANELTSLSVKGRVYAAATSFPARGNFVPTNGIPRPVHLLRRGEVTQPAKEVGPGTVDLGLEMPSRFRLAENHRETARRAALAEWIVADENPLTWRTIVNRVWQHHFDRGLVDSPNDFGRMGGKPSHPELLDWLAAEFRDGDRSLKRLHRLIVTSAVYRQVSTSRPGPAKIDGGNRLLWRQNRRRLDAEGLRDAVLFAAGDLRATMYGEPFRAFGFKDDHSPHYKYDEHDPTDPASHRRSVYRLVVRSAPDPFMETLDCADPSQIVARRTETITPLQALSLLNNSFMVTMAERTATRITRTTDNDRDQVAAAFRAVFGRAPTDDERSLLLGVVREHGLPTACRILFNTNEFVFVD